MLAQATLLGPVLRAFFGNQPIFALVISGASLLLAALSLARVHEHAAPPATAPFTPQVH